MKLRAFTLDDSGRVAVLLEAVQGGEPPTEFMLFANGVTETSKGPILFDEKAALSVMQAFEDHGLDLLPFDIGHGMLNPFAGSDAHKAAGWFKPEVRADGLYAAGIEWTESGEKSLRAREFRYFSPALLRDGESGRIKELINVALTNIPATRRQKPLVADNTESLGNHQGNETMLEEILKALGVKTGAEALGRIVQLNNDKDEAEKVIATLKSEGVRLAQQLAEVQLAQKNEKRDALIVKLSTEGKLPPSLAEWAKSQSLESLEQFAAGAPTVKPAGNGPPVSPPAAGSVTTLSAEEKDVAKQLGVSFEDFIAEKEKLAAEARA